MKTHKIIYILALSLVFSSGYAQKSKIRQATKEYDNLAYLKTSEILLEVAEKGFTSVGESSEMVWRVNDYERGIRP
jgi:hypothetical protein